MRAQVLVPISLPTIWVGPKKRETHNLFDYTMRGCLGDMRMIFNVYPDLGRVVLASGRDK